MLGIPGYETDNVAGIAAKARRRLLQALWVKVSPILSTDQYDDEDQDTVPLVESQVAPKVIEHTSVEPIPFTQQIEQATILMQDVKGAPKPHTAIVDLGYRGVEGKRRPCPVLIPFL